MTKLTPKQHEMLSRAAGAESGAFEISGEARATAASLITRGFAMSTPKQDGPSLLVITQAGRAALSTGKSQVSPDSSVGEASAGDAAPAPASAVKAPKGKVATLLELLRRPDGATLEDLMHATGWQAHSVRGAIAGAIKKKLGVEVSSTKVDGKRVYRIAQEPVA